MAEDNLMDYIPAQTTSDGLSKKWSDLETKKLITLYEENEILWNVTLKDYRNRIKKHEVLRDISNKLNIDLSEVQRKLHNLRSQYNSELKKLKKKASGQATDEIYISNWPYFTALRFIQVKSPTTSSSIAPTVKENNESIEEIELEDEATEFSSKSVAKQDSIETPQNKKRKLKPTQDVPPYVKQALSQLNQPNDQEQIFGDFCASEMRLMKNTANKRIFKKIVMEAITNIGEAEAIGAIYKPGMSFDINYAYQNPPLLLLRQQVQVTILLLHISTIICK